LKESYLHGLLFLKYLRCRQGAFLEAYPYRISNMSKLKARCPKCQLKYSIEPSFYSSAMYVSYGVVTGVAIAVYVLTLLFEVNFEPTGILLSIILALILLMPYIGAVSKLIWAHLFFNYDATISQNIKLEKNDSRT
jgi:hypothetical protein